MSSVEVSWQPCAAPTAQVGKSSRKTASQSYYPCVLIWMSKRQATQHLEHCLIRVRNSAAGSQSDQPAFIALISTTAEARPAYGQVGRQRHEIITLTGLSFLLVETVCEVSHDTISPLGWLPCILAWAHS